MTRTCAARSLGLAGALAGALVLAACSSSQVAPPSAPAPAQASTPALTPASTSLTSAAGTPVPSTSAAPAAGTVGGSPAGLTANQRHQLLTILEAVNPGVSTDEAALIDASFAVCRHITDRESGAAVTQATAQQFTNGAYVPSPEEVQAIDMAITATFCF